MKRKALFLLMVFAWIGLFIVGVSVNSTSGAPIELRVANFQPPLHKSNEMLQNWANLIEKETGGKVKFVLFPGATLAKAEDTYEATVTGVADMCWTFGGYTMGRFHLSEVVIQPLALKTAEQGARILYDLYEKFPEIRAEYKDTHLLFLCPSTPRQAHSRVPIRRLEDFKGVKVRVPPSESPHVKSLGGVPVNMAGPDVYMALERGTLDASFHPWETAFSYRWYEIVRYHTKGDFYLAGLFICTMNTNTWNKLPDDVKKVIDKYSGKYGFVEVAAKGMWDKYDDYYLDWIKKNTKNEVIYWSDEEKAKAQGLMKIVLDQWVADAEKKGLPGKKIMDECKSLIMKYK